MTLKRKINYRSTIFQVYIACEGYNEKDYFNDLNKELKKRGYSNIIQLHPKKSSKQSADGVVECAETYFSSNCLKKYKKIYCVFDKDSNTDEQIEKAIKSAKKINAEIIFSNPCFEVWFLSHFKDDIKHIETNELEAILSKNDKLGQDYKLKKANNFGRLKPKIQQAVKISKKIQKSDDIKFNMEGNPSTDIYKIIEFIENKIQSKL